MWRATGGRVTAPAARPEKAPRHRAAAIVGAGVLALLCAGLAPPCLAVDWLVLVVDRSNSIDDRELALQRNAYVRLLSDAQRDRGARAGARRDRRVRQPLRDRGRLDRPGGRRRSPTAARRRTACAARPRSGALSPRRSALLAGKSGRLVVDVSGDGRENVDHALLAQARAAATAQAIEINGLAIMNGEVPEIDRYYSGEVVNGFVLGVERGEDFLAALKRKLFYEVAGEPPAAPLVAWQARATP